MRFATRAALFALVALSCAVLAASQESEGAPLASAVDQCARFTRCSECVYDSFIPMKISPLSCSWCEETRTCSGNLTGCKTVRTSSDAPPMCSDMQCKAAKVTGNIYWCRSATIAAAFFAFELLLLSALYWFWMHAIHQVPWRYPNIHQALDQLRASSAGTPVQLKCGRRGTQGACPICHVQMDKAYGPGAVCFWCDVARFAFIPFAVGVVCSVLAIFCLFALSLRPSFADWYYAFLIVVPHLLYLGVALWVGFTQRPVVGDDENRSTAFVSLAMELRGRPLSAEFEVVKPEKPVDVKVEGPKGTDETTTCISDEDQHIDTLQALEVDTDIPSAFRNELREALRVDEYIAWAERPKSTIILVHNRWLISSFGAGMAVGLFLVLFASIPAGTYPETLLSPGPTRASGFVVLLFCAVMCAMSIGSVNRYYVLTNKRLIFLASGLFSTTHFIATDLSDVKHASVHGYQELGYTVLRFTWGVATKPTRRMPKIPPADFVGVVGIEELITKFTEHCPALDPAAPKAEMDQLRMAWRVNFGALTFFAAIAPIVLVAAQQLPPDLATVALLIWGFFIFTFAQRGWRVLSTTTAHIDVAKAQWSQVAAGFSLRALVPRVAFKNKLHRLNPISVVRTAVAAARPHTPATNKGRDKKATEL